MASAILRRAAFVEELEDRKLLAADLDLSNSGLPTPNVNAGAIIAYTVTLRNVGVDFASNVVLTNPIPANTTLVNVTPLGGPTFTNTTAPGGPVTLEIGILNPGISASFTIRVLVDPATAAGTVITDTASATTTSTETVLGNNAQTVNTVVNTQADVQVTKSGPTNVVAGTDVTYTIHVQNNGPSIADNIVLQDIIPAQTSFVSFTQTGGSGAFAINPNPAIPLPLVGQAGTVQATIAALAPAEFGDFTLVLHVASSAPAASQVFNTATVTTTTFDPAQANNFSTAGSDVDIETDVLIISNSDKLNTIYEGTFFTYTVTIYNKGPSDAQNVGFAWTTPNFGVPGPAKEGTYYGPGNPVTRVSGPAFTIGLPADPPRRGNITGALGTLPSGVASTYQIVVGTSEDNDLVQNSSVSTASPDTDPTNNSFTDNLHVFDAPLTVVTVPNIQGVAGGDISVEVMTFVDTNGWPGNSQVGAYTTPVGRFGELPDFVNGTVSWGDGTTSPVITSVDIAGTYHVTSYHRYATRGVYAVHVFVASDGEATAIGDSIATIGALPRGGTAVGNLKFTENLSETKKIADFYPDPFNSATTYTATINWGDSSSSAATLVFNSVTGAFDVIGTHNFVDQGTYIANVIVTGSDSVVNAISPITITVDDRAVIGTAVNVTALTNIAATNVTVATFTDPGGSDPVGTYTATIDWGDGTPTTTGVITLASGTYTVKGTHTYTAAGTYNMSVLLAHGTAPNTTVTPVATVTNGPVNPAVVATAVNVTANTNVAATNVAVATFTDPGGPDVVGNYTAVIDWGDGTPTTAGVVSLSGTTFTVRGTHTWTAPGTYNMVVTITHGNSPTTTVNPVATVTNVNSITSTTAVSALGVEGTTLTNVIIGRFVSANPSATVGNFTAVIDWKDGTATSAGTIQMTGPGQFNVLGTHLYKNDGTFAPVITVTPAGSTAVNITTSAVLTDAVLKGVSRLLNPTRNVTFTGLIGSYSDGNIYDLTPGEYTVTINWGDATATSNGTVAYNNTTKRWDVTGSHRYTVKSPVGGWKINFTVRDGTSQVKVTSTATVA